MQITTALSTDLTLLAQVLEPPQSDIAETLHQLVTDARCAVRSYLGLTMVTAGDAPFIFTAWQDHARAEDVRSSLLIPVPLRGGAGHEAGGAALILYADRVGAFVDLAADLSWLTGTALPDYDLDQHLPTTGLPRTELTVHARSVINQAIGVLIGRGHLPETAHEELDVPTPDGTTDRYATAVQILNSLRTDAGTDPIRHPR